MKTYVLILSRTFPVYHPKAGQPTYFKEQLQNTFFDILAGRSACDLCKYETRNCDTCTYKYIEFRKKIYTLRANFDLWEKRIAKIKAGDAILSIREWEGKPYRSKQVEIARISADDCLGIQPFFVKERKIGNLGPSWFFFYSSCVAKDGGLSTEDWENWVFRNKKFLQNKRIAIIHFTPFRYKK
ncbi:hypothetical protein [uncultured Alistipes sp.]|uniref:hypothetical protein n=1 Tax=uncultured Alistipes sp. TaxID=538949 RepID=UPI002632695C|nr:hypothetical protein [uncultured Alistipes sp.]